MRIGINALAWRPGWQVGVDRYMRELVKALQEIDSSNKYTVFLSKEARGHLKLAAKNFREVVCPIFNRWRPLRVLWEQTALAGRAQAEGIEVMLCVGGLVPQKLKVPAAQVIHDLQVFHYPENFSWIKRKFLTKMLPRCAQAARLIIAASECTREDVINCLKQPYAKIHVAWLAAAPHFEPASPTTIAQAKNKYGISGEYLLCVATKHRHKNLAALVEVYDKVIGETWPGQLLLAGRAGSGSAELRAAVRRSRHREAIRLLEHVDHNSLAGLYSGATAFVLPSLFEGFGMTVLEAMQCGCPVACSNLTALPEVADEAALLFDPRDRTQFQEALERIITDEGLREQLRQRGLAQARRFSWEATAQKTLAVLNQALEG